MASSLTRGGLLKIVSGNSIPKPIFQVVDIKKIQAANQQNNTERYRLIVSDGQHYQQAMLATQLNKYVTNNELKLHAIIQLNDYLCNNIQQRRILILLSIQVIDNNITDKIGKPENIDNALSAGGAGGDAPQDQGQPPQQQQQQYRNQNNNNNNNNSHQGGHKQISSSPEEPVFPISTLNPYQSRWTIKARVARKIMKDYTNQKGPGKLLSVDLVDGQGEIRGTAFNDTALALDQKLEENKVYFISKGQIKFANKKFNNLANEYEITFDQQTTVNPCIEDDPNIPKQSYNFKKIAAIIDMEKDATVDIIGVIREVDEPAPFNSKDGRQFVKRNVIVADDSDADIKLTLWGAQAEDSNLHAGMIVAVKSARISDFGGKSISVSGNSIFDKNPDRPEAFTLRNWYNNTGGNVAHSLSQSFTPSGAAGPTPKKNFQQAREEVIPPSQTSKFSAIATITTLKEKEEFWYAACPGRNPNDPSRLCNKKVFQLGQRWTCEKCNSSFEEPKYRYIVSLRASDYTGSLWFTAFDDVAQHLLGVDADTMRNWKQNGMDDQVSKTFKNAGFNSFNMRILAKADVVNDDTKIKYTIQAANPINYVEASKDLISMIRAYQN